MRGPEMMLETERLVLRNWQESDVEAAAAMLKYSFGDLKLARIMAFVLPQNRASVRILEKLGFQYLRDFIHAGLSHRLYEFSRH
jgi:RimJ/RimL family protein N-acetyltransferase